MVLLEKHSNRAYMLTSVTNLIEQSLCTGHLVVDYVSVNDGTTEDYISGLSATVDSYNEYNLLMGDFG